MAREHENHRFPTVEEQIDRCCPGFLARIAAASGKEVEAVIFDSFEERGTVPPKGVIFSDYSHASRELVRRCIDEALADPASVENQQTAS
jgi:hypothetical protein